MKKKIILPLILAGPAVFPAFADINYDFPNVQDWNAPNSVYPNGFKVGDSKTQVSAPVGTGSIYSQIISDYPAGKYKLVFSAVSNIKVFIDGNELTPESDGSNTSYEFDVTKGQSFQIEVSPANASEAYSFTGVNLVLIFDVKQAQQDVTNILDELRSFCPTITEVSEEDTGDYFKQGDDLRAERDALTKIYYKGAPGSQMMVVYDDGTEISASALYNLLNQYKDDPSKLAEIYSKYGYDQSPTYPVAYFEKVLIDAKKLETEIVAENQYFANYQQNLSNYNKFDTDNETLTSRIAAQLTQLEASKGISAELLETYRQQLNDLQTQAQDWWTGVQNAYKMPILDNESIWRNSVIDVTDFQSTLDQINEELSKLSENIGAADANWKIYYQVNFVDLPNLKNAYQKLLDYLDSVKGVSGYEDNFEKYIEDVETLALGQYNEAKDKLIPEIEGAVEYNDENKCQATILAAIEWLNRQLEESTELVTTQNDNMTAALKTLNDYKSDFQSIKDNTVVPDKFKEAWGKLIDAAQSAIDTFQSYIEGEYAEYELDLEEAQYESDSQAVKDALDALKKYAEDNNFAALNGIQNALDEAWKEIEDNYPEYADKLEGEKDDIQEAIDALDPTSSDLESKIKDIEQMIDDMLQHAKDLKEIQDYLDAAVKNIEETYDEWVRGKVAGDAQQLQDAIDSLDPSLESFNSSIDDIREQIDNMTQAAKDLNKVYNDINSAITKAQSAINGFNYLIASKKIQSYNGYEPSDFDNLKNYLKNYQANNDTELKKATDKLADYNEQFSEYKLLEGQNCLDKLNELLSQITSDAAFTTDLTAAEVDFEKGGTSINYNTVSGFVDKIDITPYADYAGFSKIETLVQELQTTLENINSSMGSANTVSAYQAVDIQLENLLGQILNVKAEIKNVVDNKAAYDDQTSKLATLSDWLDKLIAYNKAYSLTPAQEFFDEEIAKLQTELTTLESKIEDYYNKLQSATNQTTINGLISDFDNSVLATYKWCRDNNNAYNVQLTESTDVNAYINGLISTIDNMLNEMEEGTVSELLEGWKADLQNLLTESTDPLNWSDVNSLAFNYYGKGNSSNNNDEIIEDYEALRTAAKEIDNQLQGDTYHNAVVDANKTTTSEWTPTVNDLNNDYLEGIRDYNYFFYIPGLTNEGWKKYVEEKGIESSHKVLFTYYDQINSLNSEVLEWIAEQNANNHVISSTEWAEKMAEAEAIEKAINDQIESLISDMNSAAVDYYAILHGQVESDLAEAAAKLESQGIPSSPYMDTLYSSDKEAEGLYETAMGQEETASPMVQVGGMMDQIANILDSCLPPYDYQTWAEQQWNTEYTEAESTISDYREDINNAEFADATYRQEQMEQFESIVDKIEELNETVKGIEEGLIDDFGKYSDELEDLLSQLEEIKDNIEKNSQNNVAEKDAYNDFQDALNNQLIPGWEDLDAYAKSLAGAAIETIGNEINGPVNPEPGKYDGLKGAIEALQYFVEQNKGNLLNQNPSVDERIDGILASIEAEYDKVAKVEATYLMGTLYGKMVKEAFNNAYEYVEDYEQNKPADKAAPVLPEGYETWSEYFDAMNTQINDYESLLGATGTWGADYNYETRINWRDQSVEMEKSLCGIYASLQSVWTTNPTEEVVANLDAQKAEIQDKLEAATSALASYTYMSEDQKQEFSDRYDAFQKALEAEYESWESQGDWVIARDKFHQIALMLIGLDIEDVAADASEAEAVAKEEADKKAQSDAQYAELEQEYNDLVSQFEQLESQIGGYSESIQNAYEGTLENIQNMLDEAKEALDKAYEEGTLTSDSTLENAEAIQQAINNAQIGAALMNANEQLNAAKGARDEASQALRKNIVPEVFSDLLGEYNELNGELNGLLDDVMLPDATYESLTAIADRAKEMVDEFNRIKEEAIENTYYLGDVNDAPDGLVDVYDVQILINWILEGMTYEELYSINPRQALAADVTGDHELNIADVTTLIQWIINDKVEEMNGLKVKARTDVADVVSSVDIELIEENNNLRTYAINLNNNIAFRGGQLDIITSGNSSIKSITGANRTMNHEVLTYDLDDNKSRVVIVSMNNNDIISDNGSIIYVTVEGNDNFSIENVIFSDTDNRAHKLNKSEAAGINGIWDTISGYGERIYDAAGRMYNRIQKGINIIRHKDGKVTKEIRK